MTTTDETPQQTGDWWDRLYAEADTFTAGRTVVLPRAEVRPGGGRLPDWWAEKSETLPGASDGEELFDADQEHEDKTEAEADTAADTADTEAVTGRHAPDTAQSDGGWFQGSPGYWADAWSAVPKPHVNLPARPAISAGTRRLCLNVAAAGVGWWFGPARVIGGWIESCGREYSISGALALGVGICLVTAGVWDRRTRHWWPPLAWAARIPLASAVTALALYAPASQI
ncbi:hypothetical protein ACWD5R_43680 [Streptomyces sp. NPDC002514]